MSTGKGNAVRRGGRQPRTYAERIAALARRAWAGSSYRKDAEALAAELDRAGATVLAEDMRRALAQRTHVHVDLERIAKDAEHMIPTLHTNGPDGTPT